MRGARIITGGLAGALALAPVVPAAARTVEDEQFWASVIASAPLGGPFQGTFQMQNRMTNHASTRAALVLRGVLTMEVDDRWSVAASYAHTDMPLEPNARRGEGQLYQQISYAIGPALGGTMSSRMRLEQRWRDGRQRTGWRVRAEMRWQRRLGPSPRSVALVLAEEPVMELRRTDFGQTGGDMQFRTTIGLSVPLSQRLRIDPSYLNIYGQRQNAANLFYHVAQLTLNWRI